jgi:hypothetical protein
MLAEQAIALEGTAARGDGANVAGLINALRNAIDAALDAVAVVQRTAGSTAAVDVRPPQ